MVLMDDDREHDASDASDWVSAARRYIPQVLGRIDYHDIYLNFPSIQKQYKYDALSISYPNHQLEDLLSSHTSHTSIVHPSPMPFSNSVQYM